MKFRDHNSKNMHNRKMLNVMTQVHVHVVFYSKWVPFLHQPTPTPSSTPPHSQSGGVSQNLSSVTNDSFCYKLLKSPLLIWLSADLSLIVVIYHWKKALWNTTQMYEPEIRHLVLDQRDPTPTSITWPYVVHPPVALPGVGRNPTPWWLRLSLDFTATN